MIRGHGADVPVSAVALRVIGFGGVSALGLAVDVLVFLVLTANAVGPLLANLLSAGLAVTWVFFASVRHVFGYQGTALWSRYLLYGLYQVVAVIAASVLIDWLFHATTLPALVCKVVILPVTFTANYLVMRWLTAARPGPVA